MRLLLVSHLLLWVAQGSERLSAKAIGLIEEPDNELIFSVASLWEIAIKTSLGRSDFSVDARLLRSELLDNGYDELPVNGSHATAIQSLPTIHKDPFDRLLISQAITEGITLLTVDELVARYPGPISRV